MVAAITSKGHTMQVADSAPRTSPVMAFIKGMAGFAILILCFAGAVAAVFKVPFSPEAQFAATVVGAIGGAFLVRYTRGSPANK